MIPKEIQKEHILKAISICDKEGVPPGRESRKYSIFCNNKDYSPKYILSLAAHLATGRYLSSEKFSGGNEANGFLMGLGFEIRNKTDNKAIKTVPKDRISRNSAPKHNERCSECKDTIRKTLEALYKKVNTNYKIEISVRLDDYKNKPYYKDLKKIYQALVNYRGYTDFIRLNALHRSDLFVPDPGFLVECDESQHFTGARKAALLAYPKEMSLGYDIHQWTKYCDEIAAKDNSPVHRDEQRAWYDTLRDFLPRIKGYRPTVRIYMGEDKWCDRNPDNAQDLLLLKKKLNLPDINEAKTRQKESPELTIATAIIKSSGKYTNESRTKLLKEIIHKIEDTADVVLLPAGYYRIQGKAEKIYKYAENSVMKILSKIKRNITVCFGIDGTVGDETPDQIALAVSRKGLIARGRKFYPTKDEEITPAIDFKAKEHGYPRHFILKGKAIYLAVCYDSFGIRKEDVPNPGFDILFDLIHKFKPIGERGSSTGFFTRHGLAGAAKQWRVPVFGAVVFFNRSIPERWPSGVKWNKGGLSTRYWKYKFNPLKSFAEPSVGRGKEEALIRMFKFDDKRK